MLIPVGYQQIASYSRKDIVVGKHKGKGRDIDWMAKVSSIILVGH
jgi:hypothetical protein